MITVCPPVGTRIRDSEGDEWIVAEGGLLRSTAGLDAEPFERVRDRYGPLELTGPDHPRPVRHASVRWDLDADVVTRIARLGHPGFPEDASETYRRALEVLLAKQADYGPDNIARAPGGAINGLLVRIWDKVARLRNLLEAGVEPANEPVRDTFLDLANYALIGLMVLDGKWPGADEEGIN